MQSDHAALWDRLEAFEFSPGVTDLPFARRLARENRWTEPFALRAIQEYKKFCFLAVTTGQEVTPSDAVDQVWHLHLTYSRSYWDRFCPETLRCPLHHGPTGGSSADQTRYYRQYADTLRLYEEGFGETPPEDIWPDAKRRFLIDPYAFRVNPADVFMIPRHLGYIGGAMVVFGALVAVLWGVS